MVQHVIHIPCVPSPHLASRRSVRLRQPSRLALENNVEAVFRTVDGETSHFSNERNVDYAFASQQTDVPCTYAKNAVSGTGGKADGWLHVVRSLMSTWLFRTGPTLSPAHYTKAAPVRFSWIFVVNPTGDDKGEDCWGQHMKECIHFN